MKLYEKIAVWFKPTTIVKLMSGTNVHAQTFFQDYSINIAATVTKFSGCS